MKARALLLAVMAAIGLFMLVGGCIGNIGGRTDNVSTAGMVTYMGLAYGPSERNVSPEGLLYTGAVWNGSKIYVDMTSDSEKVPSLIVVNNSSGGFSAYSKLATNPPVYAYTLCTRYNTGEAVTFGLMNEGDRKIDLRNSAPWEVQLNTSRGWEPVYHPVAAQVVVPLENDSFKEWTWNQRLDNDSIAPFGDYRIVINGEYGVEFQISKGSPAVMSVNESYDNRTINNLFWSCPQHDAFNYVYRGRLVNVTFDLDREYDIAL